MKLQKSTKSYLLIFYGKKIGNCHLPGNAACCIYITSSAEVLTQIFDEMHKILARASDVDGFDLLIPCVRGLHFVDYEFSHLPDNIGRVFSGITQCTFYKCHGLISLSSTVRQFLSLTSLSVRDCHNLTSLSSLSDIPRQTSLQALRINNCGLCIASDRDWEEAMKAIGNTPSMGLVLNITSCHHLRRLPTSMKYLGRVLSCLRLESNCNLDCIPDIISEMNTMVEFQLINCPSMYSLPPNMGRLRNDCKVSITGNDNLIEKICHDTVKDNGSKESSYFSQKIGKMQGHFLQSRVRQLKTVARLSVLLRRARLRANHRIYQPGGVGFLRCRDHFNMMVGLHDSQDLGGNLIDSLADESDDVTE